MEFEDILYEERDAVATITINRPEVMNAFRARTCEELLEAFRRASWNRDIAVIVLRKCKREMYLAKRES